MGYVSGIYKITSPSGRIYIGQSSNIYRRKAEHFSALFNNNHINPLMQEEWNKSGGKGWRWEPVEFCSVEELNEKEKYWITKCGSMAPRGFNIGWTPFHRTEKQLENGDGYKKFESYERGVNANGYRKYKSYGKRKHY